MPKTKEEKHESHKESVRKWNAAHPEALRMHKRRYRADGRYREYEKQYARKRWLKKEYGLALEDYDRMASDQGGVCAICGGPPNGGVARLCVDHDHDSGEIRGLLCNLCNRMIGFAKDDAELLQRASDYILAVRRP